jgi:hypothetical protein
MDRKTASPEAANATVASTSREFGNTLERRKIEAATDSVATTRSDCPGASDGKNSPERTANAVSGRRAEGCGRTETGTGEEYWNCPDMGGAAEPENRKVGVGVGVWVTSAGQSAEISSGRAREAVSLPKALPRVGASKYSAESDADEKTQLTITNRLAAFGSRNTSGTLSLSKTQNLTAKPLFLAYRRPLSAWAVFS